jgi:protein LTV1
MTSSVIRRNEKLKLLDEQFDSIYSEYDDDQIGALDTEEIDGFVH